LESLGGLRRGAAVRTPWALWLRLLSERGFACFVAAAAAAIQDSVANADYVTEVDL
jgi:hypothetical protein